MGLPRPAAIAPPLRRFLSARFSTAEGYSDLPAVEAELRGRCADLEASILDLRRRLAGALADYASTSVETRCLLEDVKDRLADLRSSLSSTPQDGEGEEKFHDSEQILAEELPALAREVARVETVRAYADTALKLDRLIGDMEDAVSSLAGKLRAHRTVNSEESYIRAIDCLKKIEDVLASIAKSRPQWSHLISAVDHRVDRGLAVLRPQAIADHRALLASLGWPPPLSSSTIKSSDFLNPLDTMSGAFRTKYSESFLSLCNLQELQRRRKVRQLEGHNLEIALRQPLWAIEELANPISVASQRHFSKWKDKPEFIFALVYKITSEYVVSMDEILQPLVDKARLVGCSCREEWIAAMMTSLSTYLAREIFPEYIDQLQDESSTAFSQAKISWLHLVDLMISFDKRIYSLITSSGLTVSVEEYEISQRTSSLSVFCDRPDWLELWAEIELVDMLKKLKPGLEDEKSWKTKIHETLLMTGLESYKSPAVAGIFLQSLASIIDRSRPLPSISLRVRFLRLAGAPILREFIDFLFRRCQEAEGLTALVDDEALIKVTNSLNAVRYTESILTEWLEDVFFLEMETVSDQDFSGGCIFQEEMSAIKEFRSEWLQKISNVILRGFDTHSREYVKNKRHWQEKEEEGWSVSRTLVGALDFLQAKIVMLEEELNAVDFVGIWRSVATGIDQLLYNSVILSGAKFSDAGVERLDGDLRVLFGVFSAWCLRPEGFFPRLSESLKLLKMER